MSAELKRLQKAIRETEEVLRMVMDSNKFLKERLEEMESIKHTQFTPQQKKRRAAETLVHAEKVIAASDKNINKLKPYLREMGIDIKLTEAAQKERSDILKKLRKSITKFLKS